VRHSRRTVLAAEMLGFSRTGGLHQLLYALTHARKRELSAPAPNVFRLLRSFKPTSDAAEIGQLTAPTCSVENVAAAAVSQFTGLPVDLMRRPEPASTKGESGNESFDVHTRSTVDIFVFRFLSCTHYPRSPHPNTAVKACQLHAFTHRRQNLILKMQRELLRTVLYRCFIARHVKVGKRPLTFCFSIYTNGRIAITDLEVPIPE
jgi:hypothetical protein